MSSEKEVAAEVEGVNDDFTSIITTLLSQADELLKKKKLCFTKRMEICFVAHPDDNISMIRAF